MARRRWTEYEEAWLAQVWPKTGIPSKAVAHALKRTVNAIWMKAQRLGINRPWIGSPENLEILNRAGKKFRNSPEGREHLKRISKKGLEKAQETYLGSPKNLERLKRAGRIAHKTWSNSPENLEHLKRIGKKGREKLRAKPTWPEAIFYGLVFGYDGLAEEFHAQELIPTTICNHTVDGRRRDTIFELDGGGHSVYRDVTEHDHLIDAEYQKMGYQVVREGTANDLFLRLLQAAEKA